MGGKCNAAVALEAFAAAFKRAHENWGLLGYFHGVKGDDSEYFSHDTDHFSRMLKRTQSKAAKICTKYSHHEKLRNPASRGKIEDRCGNVQTI